MGGVGPLGLQVSDFDERTAVSGKNSCYLTQLI